MSRDWLPYLDDLIDSAEKIQRFLKGRTFDGFASAVPEGDWSGPARMRDLIAHRYFSIDPQIVWGAATQHVPRMLGHAQRLRERFDRGDDSSGQTR